jgi:hypothetical protein
MGSVDDKIKMSGKVLLLLIFLQAVACPIFNFSSMQHPRKQETGSGSAHSFYPKVIAKRLGRLPCR